MAIVSIKNKSKYGEVLAGNTPPGRGFTLLNSVTVGSGGAATIDFTSIPATYTHLQLRIIAQTTRSATPNDIVFLQFNSDTGSNYTEHWLYGDGSSAGAVAGAPRSKAALGYVGSTNITNSIGCVVTDILDYANTNKYKTVRALGGVNNNDTSNGWVSLNSGVWMNTNAITSMKLFPNVGPNFAQYSHFALYGILGV